MKVLESALTRPQMAAYYEGADIVRQADAAWHRHLAGAAFLDGNKRTAFQTLDAFLWVNGWEYVGAPLELARQFEQFAERSYEPDEAIEAFEAWLRRTSSLAWQRNSVQRQSSTVRPTRHSSM